MDLPFLEGEFVEMKIPYNLVFTAIGLTPKRTPYPKILCLRIVQQCNFICQYCFSRIYPTFRERKMHLSDMLPEQVNILLSDAWTLGCKEVHLGGLGEVTLHPNFYQFLSWAKEIGYSISFTSNGWILDPKKLDMLDTNDLIRISIDNMHLTGSPDPQKYISKINTIFKNKQKNYQIIAVTHGDFSLEIKSMFQESEIKVFNYPLLKAAISTSTHQKRIPLIRCIDPYHSISITPDLKVPPCSCSSGPTMGQITDGISLKDIWCGENMQKFRQNMYSNNPPDICKQCDKWDRGIGEWRNAYLRCLKVLT